MADHLLDLLASGMASPASIESDTEMGFYMPEPCAPFAEGSDEHGKLLFSVYETDSGEEEDVRSEQASASLCGSRDAMWNPDSPGEVVLSPASLVPPSACHPARHDSFDHLGRSLFSSAAQVILLDHSAAPAPSAAEHFAAFETAGSLLDSRMAGGLAPGAGALGGHGGSSLRTAHNAMEKERRVNLRKLFLALQGTLPKLRDAKAPSLQILTEAAQYIQALREEEARLDAMKAQLLHRNAVLRAALVHGVPPACDPLPLH